MIAPRLCVYRTSAGGEGRRVVTQSVSQSVGVSRCWLTARLRRIKLHSVVAFDISTVKLFYLRVGFYDLIVLQT